MDSLASALRLPPRRYLRSRWPWRALLWCAQAGVAAAVMVGLIALWVQATWQFGGDDTWLTLGLLVQQALLTGLVLVGFAFVIVWQRRAVTLLGCPPIVSRASWAAPGARRPGDLVVGALVDLLAAVVFLPFGVLAFAISWLVWIGPYWALFGVLVIVEIVWNGDVPPMYGFYLGIVLGALIATLAVPWLWGLVAHGAQWCLRRIIDPVGDVAARQLAHRQAATVRLSDVFATERRRIERDLHDGAQQRIVAQAVTLGRLRHVLAAQRPVTAEMAAAVALAEQAAEENRLILRDLRQLVRSVRPQVLADLGLAAALEEVTARSAVPVHATIDVPARHASLVEDTVYFVALEALTNVAKHAAAQQVELEVRQTDEAIDVRVSDDGLGGATIDSDGGLAGLVDRVGAIGGRMWISSPPGGPTTVRASVPRSIPRADEQLRDLQESAS